MAERFTIVVAPASGHENMTVQDAMHQVLSIFELLDKSARIDGKEVVWRLIEAKTNSPPLTIVAEAFPIYLGDDIDEDAKFQKKIFSSDLEEFKAGHIPDRWNDNNSLKSVKSLLSKLGATTRLDIYINPLDAPISLTEIDKANYANLEVENAMLFTPEIFKKEQFGSINGIFTAVKNYHGSPAVTVRENKTGREITCVISGELTKRIPNSLQIGDVWQNAPVVVRGRIFYGDGHVIKRIKATDIRRRELKNVSLNEIKDVNFTNGIPVSEYLDKLREGEIG